MKLSFLAGLFSAIFLLIFVLQHLLLRHTILVPPSTASNPTLVKDREFPFGVDPQFRIVPHYLTSLSVPNRSDVTLVTQGSIDRLDKLQFILLAWDGPVSFALYVKHPSDLDKICKIHNEDNDFGLRVDVHLVFSNNTRYPSNTLRNIAITNIRTAYAFLIDIDFVPSPGLHAYLRANHEAESARITELRKKLASWSFHKSKYPKPRIEKRVFVVAAFETDELQNPLRDHFPTTKEELYKMRLRGVIQPANLHRCWKCHGPTNYLRWYNATEPYEVAYQWIYEPFISFEYVAENVDTESRGLRRTTRGKESIVNTVPEPFPLFEERLKGYGFDKNSHAFHLAIAGYRFVVLPMGFIIHVNHPEATWEGPSHSQQQWEALAVVCELFERLRVQYGYEKDERVFDEPLPSYCMTNWHW